MTSFDYDAWWSLHLRVAKGERLSAQEERAYQAGLHQIEEQAQSADDMTITYLRSLRAAIVRASNLHAELTDRRAELDQQIITLEANYRRVTGQSLDLHPHASA